MTLVVDIGNTRLKWAHAKRGYLADQGHAFYPRSGVTEVLEEHWSSLVPPYRVLACNVAGAVIADALSGWVARHWSCPVDFVAARPEGWGVTNAYLEPGRLGADRWAALIAAHRRVSAPVCIVDCGTAITIDVLAAGGQHLGGLILPGLTLMRRILARHTDAIPEVSGGSPSLLARSTNDAVAAGTLYAPIALVERVIADSEAALEAEVICIACGGDAHLFAPHFARSVICEHDLVLQGTAVIAEGLA